MQWQCKIESYEEHAESDKQEGEQAKSKQQHIHVGKARTK